MTRAAQREQAVDQPARQRCVGLRRKRQRDRGSAYPVVRQRYCDRPQSLPAEHELRPGARRRPVAHRRRRARLKNRRVRSRPVRARAKTAWRRPPWRQSAPPGLPPGPARHRCRRAPAAKNSGSGLPLASRATGARCAQFRRCRCRSASAARAAPRTGRRSPPSDHCSARTISAALVPAKPRHRISAVSPRGS